MGAPTVISLSPADESPPSEKRSWQACLQNIPWSAMGLLLLVLACMVVCASIIAISDHREVHSWKIQPAVLLAVFSSILNFALATTLSISVAISWWRSALHGTTLERLHYIANRGAGRSFLPAFFGGLDTNKVALIATLIAIVKFVNNPLLQRATHVESTAIIRNETLTLDIAERLPDGFAGSIEDASVFTIIGSRHGLSTMQGWFWNETITTSTKQGYFCDGKCEGQVRGAGISYSCTSTEKTLDISTTDNNGAVMFMINTTVTESSTAVPSIILTVLHSSAVSDSCVATITIDTCKIEAAIVQYPVIIQNTTVLLNQAQLQHIPVLSIYISPGDLLTAPAGAGAGPLEGLSDFIGGYLNTNITVTVFNSPRKAIYGGSNLMIADLFFQAERSSYSNHTFSHCGLKWTSPTSYALNAMHNFMFRAALSVGNGTEPQNFAVSRSSPTLLFHSDYRFLGAALAVMFIACIALTALLWGWWDLGRSVSLSPLETAKAFNASLMERAGRNSTVEEMIKEVGAKKIRYLPGQGIVTDQLCGGAGDLERASNRASPQVAEESHGDGREGGQSIVIDQLGGGAGDSESASNRTSSQVTEESHGDGRDGGQGIVNGELDGGAEYLERVSNHASQQAVEERHLEGNDPGPPTSNTA